MGKWSNLTSAYFQMGWWKTTNELFMCWSFDSNLYQDQSCLDCEENSAIFFGLCWSFISTMRCSRCLLSTKQSRLFEERKWNPQAAYILGHVRTGCLNTSAKLRQKKGTDQPRQGGLYIHKIKRIISASIYMHKLIWWTRKKGHSILQLLLDFFFWKSQDREKLPRISWS